MTVATSTNKVEYACNDSVTEFNIPYKFFKTSDIAVTLEDDTTLAQTPLVEGVDYNITTDNPDFSDGATLTTVPTYDTGNTIIIVRELPYVQLTDYQEGDAFPAEAHEDALDYLTMLIQQIIESGVILQGAASAPQGSIVYSDGTNWVTLFPGVDGQYLKTQGDGANPIYDTPAGGGDVLGPAGATTNTVVVFDGTTGKLVKATGVTIENGKVTIPDSATYAVLNITERNTPPTTAVVNDIYLDDGTNTSSGSPGFRRCVSTGPNVWEDIGAAGGGGLAANKLTARNLYGGI